MALIKGMTVTLLIKKQVGVDGFNHPIFDYVEEKVEDVLVVPSSSDDIATAQDLYGKKAVYTLGIPKGDTHDWINARILFLNQKWKSFGFPLEGMEDNIPLRWNKKVMVERYG